MDLWRSPAGLAQLSPLAYMGKRAIVHRMWARQHRMHARPHAAICASFLLASCAQASAPIKPGPLLEARVFSCEGFAKHADGAWWAGPNTLPFNVGNDTPVLIQNAGPINRHFAVFATGEN